MIFVVMSLMAVFVVGLIAGRRFVNTSSWELFEFSGANFSEYVSFETERADDVISAVLTNVSESNVSHGAAFTLVKLTDEEAGKWRIFPFDDEVAFVGIELALLPGHGVRYTLTEDMLAYRLMAGQYRIVVDFSADGENFMQAWAGFELLER